MEFTDKAKENLFKNFQKMNTASLKGIANSATLVPKIQDFFFSSYRGDEDVDLMEVLMDVSAQIRALEMLVLNSIILTLREHVADKQICGFPLSHIGDSVRTLTTNHMIQKGVISSEAVKDIYSTHEYQTPEEKLETMDPAYLEKELTEHLNRIKELRESGN